MTGLLSGWPRAPEPPVLKVMGIVEVAALAARAAVMPVATSTATGRRTNSEASAGKRS
jgi:hypothetical protein